MWHYMLMADKLLILYKRWMLLVLQKSIVEAGILKGEYAHVAESCAETTYYVENKESFWAPNIFEHATKHIEGEHVEENVPNTAMHKHVCKGLPPAKQWRLPVMETEGVIKIYAPGSKAHPQKKNKDIYNEEVFYNQRQLR
jgi:hypothetical protein